MTLCNGYAEPLFRKGWKSQKYDDDVNAYSWLTMRVSLKIKKFIFKYLLERVCSLQTASYVTLKVTSLCQKHLL